VKFISTKKASRIFCCPLFCCCWIRDLRSGIQDGKNQVNIPEPRHWSSQQCSTGGTGYLWYIILKGLYFALGPDRIAAPCLSLPGRDFAGFIVLAPFPAPSPLVQCSIVLPLPLLGPVFYCTPPPPPPQSSVQFSETEY
jgi:hypothetical protein